MDYFDILLANRINGGAGGGVSDVKVNGTSVVEGGVANIPVAPVTGNTSIQEGTNSYKLIVPAIQNAAAFYGLAKAAGDSTQSASINPVGVYTDTAKEKIQKMLGIVTLTQAEYDALTTKSASTIYIITED